MVNVVDSIRYRCVFSLIYSRILYEAVDDDTAIKGWFFCTDDTWRLEVDIRISYKWRFSISSWYRDLVIFRAGYAAIVDISP